MPKGLTSKAKLHIILTLSVMVFIFVQSALTGEVSGAESNVIVQFVSGLTGIPAESLGLFVRKAAHFTEFMILGMCLTLNVKDRLQLKAAALDFGRLWPASWLIATAYAATDEIHQLFVPERACAFVDVCIDSCGAALGAFVAGLVLLRRKNKES